MATIKIEIKTIEPTPCSNGCFACARCGTEPVRLSRHHIKCPNCGMETNDLYDGVGVWNATQDGIFKRERMIKSCSESFNHIASRVISKNGKVVATPKSLKYFHDRQVDSVTQKDLHENLTICNLYHIYGW